jgi:hypothetical protein
MSFRIHTHNRGYDLLDSRTIQLDFVLLFFMLRFAYLMKFCLAITAEAGLFAAKPALPARSTKRQCCFFAAVVFNVSRLQPARSAWAP